VVLPVIPTWGDGRRVRIGLLGGSFNPVHRGHLEVAARALRMLALDQVWLMVSPGNPLKPVEGMAPFAERLSGVRAVVDGKRILASDIERRLGTRYTVDTITALRLRFPNASFVWLMGADGLASLPRWRDWRTMVATVPIAVLPRPRYNMAALFGQAARVMARDRCPARAAPLLVRERGHAWAFLPGPQNGISATALRETARTDPGHPSGETIIASKPPSSDATPKRRTAASATGAATPTKPKAPKRVTDPALAEAAKAAPTPRKKAAVAGPRRRVKREPVSADKLELYLGVITESLADDKAEDIVVIDLTGRAAFADRMVIATGLADRQISAMSAHLERKLADAGLKRVSSEGANGSDWVLIDAGDIVIHLFKAEARALYGLEKMWGADLDEPEEGPVTTL